MSALVQSPPEVRVAVLGNVDSGKSTLIGVLISGNKDNGRGLARKQVFTHRHEDETGRTSAVSMHIMGFDKEQTAVYQAVAASATAEKKNKGWAEVVNHSASIVSFIDLAGHEKYLKTTIAGLTGSYPDYALVLVNSLAGIMKMTKEHLGVVLALELPVCVVVTKVDMCPPNVLKRTKVQLFKILKSGAAGRKMPIHVREQADVKTVLDSQVANFSNHVVPVIEVSSVSGEGLDLLLAYTAGLRPGRHMHLLGKALMQPPVAADFKDDEDVKEEAVGPAGAAAGAVDDAVPTATAGAARGSGDAGVGGPNSAAHAVAEGPATGPLGLAAEPAEFQIDHTFQVPGTGLVVSGTLTHGTVNTNDHLWLGPIGSHGEFVEVLIRTIHAKRLPVDVATTADGCAAYCFAIRPLQSKGKKEALKRTRIRRGMVLLQGSSAAEVNARASCRSFEAEVMVLHHHSTIKQDYQAVVHMGDVRQTAVIERIALIDANTGEAATDSEAALRTGDRARIVFRFLFKPEYVRGGCVFLFREGSTKGVGRVVRSLGAEEAELCTLTAKAGGAAKLKAQKEAA